jgi:hypothetical protein
MFVHRSIDCPLQMQMADRRVQDARSVVTLAPHLSFATATPAATPRATSRGLQSNFFFSAVACLFFYPLSVP